MSQDEERRLKHVLGVLRARQNAVTDSENQGRMSPDQRGEGVFVL